MSIFRRVSTRNFLKKEVEQEKIDIILKAAMAAPSARNYQPWHFVIIKERNSLEEITKFHPFSNMLHECELAILVCGDLNIQPDDRYIALDCGASTQNILLQCEEVGLGSCWLGIYPREERIEKIKKLFLLPHNIIPISLVAIGYKKENQPQVSKYNHDRIRLEKW